MVRLGREENYAYIGKGKEEGKVGIKCVHIETTFIAGEAVYSVCYAFLAGYIHLSVRVWADGVLARGSVRGCESRCCSLYCIVS